MKKVPRSPPIVIKWYPRRITDGEPPPPLFPPFIELRSCLTHTAGLIENIRCRRALSVHTHPLY